MSARVVRNEAGGERSDYDLVRLSIEGDQQAFSDLYHRHAPVLSRRLLRVLGRSDEVRDVMQVTFLELHRALERYEPDRSFAAWLNGFAFFVAARHLRAKRRRWWLRSAPSADLEAVRDLSVGPDRQVETRVLVRAVYAVLDTLPEKQRVAFALHVFDGMGLTEIGSLTGDSPQTVRARVESARAKIQKKLKGKVES